MSKVQCLWKSHRCTEDLFDSSSTSERNTPVDLEVSAALPNTKSNRPTIGIRLLPSLSNDVPDAQIISGQGNRNALALPGVELDIGETFENGRRSASRFGEVEVDLGDLHPSQRQFETNWIGYGHSHPHRIPCPCF